MSYLKSNKEITNELMHLHMREKRHLMSKTLFEIIALVAESVNIIEFLKEFINSVERIMLVYNMGLQNTAIVGSHI